MTVPPEAAHGPLVDLALLDLFKIELETQCKALNQGLIEWERQPGDQVELSALMRAAHSIKGAARIVEMPLLVRLAHALEDGIVLLSKDQPPPSARQMDPFLRVVDFFARLSTVAPSQIALEVEQQQPLIDALIAELKGPPLLEVAQPPSLQAPPVAAQGWKKTGHSTAHPDRVLRITAQHLNRLMGLAGESLVQSQWFYPFEKNLRQVKTQLKELSDHCDALRNSLRKEQLNDSARAALLALHRQIEGVRADVADRLLELDTFIRGHARLSDRLYREVVDSRMRPFSDGVAGFPRLVRDLAHQLGKKVRLSIAGLTTLVDRDLLERLESPLSHLLRNAVDHGIESLEERRQAGKPEEGVIHLEARHSGGTLAITVSDDGRGVDIARLRAQIARQNLWDPHKQAGLTDQEVLDFLFLPGFSTAAGVSEISGRGVGLNIVQNALKEVGGSMRIQGTPGKGLAFHLKLPLTLSVMRALLVEIAGEPYAFPLVRVDQTFMVDPHELVRVEGRPLATLEGRSVELIPAWQLLELSAPSQEQARLPVIMIGERRYGIMVDRLIGERELVVQELDARLGKIPDISAGALMEDGAPVLIIDVEELVLSMDQRRPGPP